MLRYYCRGVRGRGGALALPTQPSHCTTVCFVCGGAFVGVYWRGACPTCVRFLRYGEAYRSVLRSGVVCSTS